MLRPLCTPAAAAAGAGRCGMPGRACLAAVRTPCRPVTCALLASVRGSVAPPTCPAPQENYTNYDKGVLAEILEPIMGKGLIPADMETWKVRRRAIVPGEAQAPPPGRPAAAAPGMPLPRPYPGGAGGWRALPLAARDHDGRSAGRAETGRSANCSSSAQPLHPPLPTYFPPIQPPPRP